MIAIVLTIIMLLGMTISANAESKSYPQIERSFSMTSDKWTQIAYRQGGLDLNLVVKAHTTEYANGNFVQYDLEMRAANKVDVI